MSKDVKQCQCHVNSVRFSTLTKQETKKADFFRSLGPSRRVEDKEESVCAKVRGFRDNIMKV